MYNDRFFQRATLHDDSFLGVVPVCEFFFDVKISIVRHTVLRRIFRRSRKMGTVANGQSCSLVSILLGGFNCYSYG